MPGEGHEPEHDTGFDTAAADEGTTPKAGQRSSTNAPTNEPDEKAGDGSVSTTSAGKGKQSKGDDT